jgi:23S rRNA maturation-related 3'-5' exoribonuclease YhaM
MAETKIPGAEALNKLRKEFEGLLLSTERDNMESLLLWLEEESDFYTAPASTNGHCAYEGGLLVHSVNVYKLLYNFNKNIKCEHEESLVIAGLLHDICKTNMYAKGIRNVNTPGKR